MRAVAVDILTGFLGSGKTTLLRHALAHGLHGQPIAVIMNEIGAIGIDGRVVTGLTHVERMVELSNGCICCTIDDYRFDRALQEILDTTHPHAIIIESTGLADPLALAERVTAAGLGLDAIITVVDAAHIERQLADAVVASQQIAAADFLVLNKLDLVPPAALAGLRARMQALNSRAASFETTHGAIDTDVLFATGVARHRRTGVADASHLARDDYASFVHHSAAPLDADAFEAVVEQLPAEVIRAKGVVRFVADQRPYLFNFTCGRADLAALPGFPGDGGQMVFIGRGVRAIEPALRAALVACERTPSLSAMH